MQIQGSAQDGAYVAAITGEIDGKTAPEAQGILLPLLEAHPCLVLDLKDVTFMSSAGLRMMLLIYRQATARKAKLALVGLNEQIKDTMSATGFLAFFALSDSVEAAIAGFGPGK